MFTRKTILSVLVVSIVGLLFVSQTLSQPQQGQQGQRGQRGQRGGANTQRQRGQFDPERMRQMMSQRMQELFGATDAEWKILGPRVTKVMELNRQVGSSGRGGMMMFGRRGGPQGGGPQGNQQGGPGGRFGCNSGANQESAHYIACSQGKGQTAACRSTARIASNNYTSSRSSMCNDGHFRLKQDRPDECTC
jgi:hypothetical protein